MTKPTGAYAFLNAEPGPRMLVEMLKIFGTLETPGAADNPVILGWADEVAAACPTPYNVWAAKFYEHDSIAFCGLGMAVVAVRANPDKRPDRNPPDKYLSAASWASFGVEAEHAELGDVLVFQRPGGGHVSLYVGHDATTYHCLGANQSDTVNVTRIAKGRCIAIRRPPYVVKPANVRPVA
jgi:uncharacterized protein (TIGR02594 family)